MDVKLKKGETFEKMLRRFSKKVQKDELIDTYRKKQVFEPKSVKRQQQKANKLRKSRESWKRKRD
jgi:ribosomal protein S21